MRGEQTAAVMKQEELPQTDDKKSRRIGRTANETATDIK